MRINKKTISETLIFLLLAIITINSFLDFSGFIIIKHPRNNDVIYDRYPEFLWKGNSDSYIILISNDNNFENPIVREDLNTSYYRITDKLKFGTYYWKIIDRNNRERISKFTVQSLVSVSYDEEGNIRNEGNTKLAVDGNFLASGASVLDVNRFLSKKLIGENLTFQQNE